MKEKRFLFITNSDLSDTDANGRTLRDVFSFVDNKNLYSFCIKRTNKQLSADHVFLADESKIKKGREFKKNIHREASIEY